MGRPKGSSGAYRLAQKKVAQNPPINALRSADRKAPLHDS